MKRILLITALLATATACVAPSPNSTPTETNTSNANVAVAPPTAPATTSAAAQVPITLPVLDAMFADETFAAELKSKLSLSDEQIGKLRQIARDETASLKEETDNGHGSTSEATSRADEKIRSVVGEENSRALADFVRERWSGGVADALSAKPNSVPTDTRVVVNAPAYRMDVFENGKLAKSYKVGIGYPEFPLPQGLRKASSIIFNPTWTPPDEPWVEGSNKVKPGQKIEAGSKLNPLGVVKIPIGQPSLIHGGKAPAKLGTFASHGCVGLTNPLAQDFSLLLARLGGAELTPADVAIYAKNRTETKNVKLANTVPVELRYETIVAEDGRLHIYRDVYDKNTNTEENLKAVLDAQGVSLDDLTEQERTQVLDAIKLMARDAKGKPTDGTPTPTPDAKKLTDKHMTRTVKGEKEMVIEIGALKGKGYPAPLGEGFDSPKPVEKKPSPTPAPAKTAKKAG
jgi:lipoprotein-anchoring transpeptidase ErfK/SrfK